MLTLMPLRINPDNILIKREGYRKVGDEIMASITRLKSIEDPVHLFTKNKEGEGKTNTIGTIAGLNKFLLI